MGAARTEGDTLLFETDWLGTRPVFYNASRGTAGHDVWAQIDLGALTLDVSAVADFLDFGFSVFGRTPVEGVHVLPPHSRLWRRPDGTLHVETLADPVDELLEHRLPEAQIIEQIRDRVQAWEAASTDPVILPISGGLDSRLLAWSLARPAEAMAFTYGLSPRQEHSNEATRAQVVAERLGIPWQRVPLGDQHAHLAAWDEAFGCSTHAHGMYQLEFFGAVRGRLGSGPARVLSGLLGDAWAGSIEPQPKPSPQGLSSLGLSHGLRVDPRHLRAGLSLDARRHYLAVKGEHLDDPRRQVLEVARFKIILLSYLLRVPTLHGMEAWTPYLDLDLVMAMLNLPDERRQGRRWQREFFAGVGLDVEASAPGSDRNTLNLAGMRRQPLPALNVALLEDLVDPDFLVWVNDHRRATTVRTLASLGLATPKVRGVLRRLGVRDQLPTAYAAWVCLHPLATLLAAQQGCSPYADTPSSSSH